MKKIITFCENNILEILFLFGAIDICLGYYFCFEGFSARWAKCLCGASAFTMEFAWLIFLSSFAKTMWSFSKLLLLNLIAIICLVIISLSLCGTNVSQGITILIVLVGIFSFLCSWVVLAAIIHHKKAHVDLTEDLLHNDN